MKTGIIYHRIDFDGLLSAVVVLDALSKQNLGKVDLIGYNYGDPGIDVDNLARTEGYTHLILVDITLPTDQMVILNELSLHGICSATWIDHHATAISDSINLCYSDLPGLRQIGKAACELCWEFYHPNTAIPPVLLALSCYDVWDSSRLNWESEVLPIQYAMRAEYNLDILLLYKEVDKVLSMGMDTFNSLASSGRSILNYLKGAWKTNVGRYAFDITVGPSNLKGMACMNVEFGSSPFLDVLDPDVDIMCCVNRLKEGNGFACSMYVRNSDTSSFSAGEYLKLNYGGGGHKGAAGCTLTKEQFDRLIVDRKI